MNAPNAPHAGQAPPSLDALNAAHEFPGRYVFKAIGPGGGSFEADVISAVRTEVVVESHVQASTRASKEGRHLSVTVDALVASAEQVQLIYHRIRTVPGLVLLL